MENEHSCVFLRTLYCKKNVHFNTVKKSVDFQDITGHQEAATNTVDFMEIFCIHCEITEKTVNKTESSS